MTDAEAAARVPLADQIKAVGRELGMRKGVYPKWVRSGRMTQAEADKEIAAMDAVYATLKALQSSQEPARARSPRERSKMTEQQIKHMVDRFLAWRLPKDFSPDNGISYTRPSYHPSVDATPSGTNLLDARQATEMVRHLIEELPPDAARDAEIAEEARRHLIEDFERRVGEIAICVRDAQGSIRDFKTAGAVGVPMDLG